MHTKNTSLPKITLHEALCLTDMIWEKSAKGHFSGLLDAGFLLKNLN